MDTLTAWQVDARNALMYACTDMRSIGWRQVAVAPPDAPVGHIQVWVSARSPKTDPLWATDGVWDVQEDHSKSTLYIERGRTYAVGSDHDGQRYDGLGPVPAWLHIDEPPAPIPTLEEAQATKLREINIGFEGAAQALTDGYPEGERLTWPVQQSEALAWALNPAVSTPYLDGLALARGIEPAEMRQLTLDQVQLFMQASQQLVGTRQRLRDEVYAAVSLSEVAAIVWSAIL